MPYHNRCAYLQRPVQVEECSQTQARTLLKSCQIVNQNKDKRLIHTEGGKDHEREGVPKNEFEEAANSQHRPSKKYHGATGETVSILDMLLL